MERCADCDGPDASPGLPGVRIRQGPRHLRPGTDHPGKPGSMLSTSALAQFGKRFMKLIKKRNEFVLEMERQRRKRREVCCSQPVEEQRCAGVRRGDAGVGQDLVGQLPDPRGVPVPQVAAPRHLPPGGSTRRSTRTHCPALNTELVGQIRGFHLTK